MHRAKRYMYIGILFTVLAGTLLHFVYDWSGRSPFVGLFSPVNESTWEHLKLLYYPMLIHTLWEYAAAGRRYPCFLTGRALGMLAGMGAIIVLFYTYTGILGRHILFLDIVIFIAGVFAAYITAWFIYITKIAPPQSMRRTHPATGRISPAKVSALPPEGFYIIGHSKGMAYDIKKPKLVWLCRLGPALLLLLLLLFILFTKNPPSIGLFLEKSLTS